MISYSNIGVGLRTQLRVPYIGDSDDIREKSIDSGILVIGPYIRSIIYPRTPVISTQIINGLFIVKCGENMLTEPTQIVGLFGEIDRVKAGRTIGLTVCLTSIVGTIGGIKDIGPPQIRIGLTVSKIFTDINGDVIITGASAVHTLTEGKLPPPVIVLLIIGKFDTCLSI